MSERGQYESARVDRGAFCLMARCFGYLALALVMTSKSQQLLVLPGHEVDGGVFQQSGEDEEEAHRHPDVYSLHIGDLSKEQSHLLYLAYFYNTQMSKIVQTIAYCTAIYRFMHTCNNSRFSLQILVMILLLIFE